ncbi:MAG: hypothetical protein WB760_32520 [Xanthobacteraceae bacterium]
MGSNSNCRHTFVELHSDGGTMLAERTQAEEIARLAWRALATIVAVLAVAVTAYAQSPPPEGLLWDLLKQQHVLGTFGNWLVSDGQAIVSAGQMSAGQTFGSKYCAATSLTVGQGGRVSLRIVLDSPTLVEWRIFPSDTMLGQGLNEIEAKKLLFADLISSDDARRGASTTEATVWVGAQSPFPVPFSLIRIKHSEWLVELETLDGVGRVANWVLDKPEMRIAFPNTGVSDVIVSMTGFPAAFSALKNCVG